MNIETEVVASTDLNDDLLADLVLDTCEDVTDSEIIEALGGDDLDAVEVLNEKSDALEGQTSTIEATTEAAEKPAKEKKAPKERKAAAPKVERDLNAIGDEFFQLDVNGTADKAAVIATRPTQKKVAEKFDGLFTSIAAGRHPSIYTMVCFRVLEAAGEVTSSDLVAAMKASASRSGSAYSEGTARSQVGQMMNLFDVVGIAQRSGNKLTFNKDSKLAERLAAL